VSGSSSGQIKLFNLKNSEIEAELNTNLNLSVTSFLVLQENRLVSSSSDGTLHIWNTNTHELIHKLDAFKSRVNSLVLLIDDQTLAAAYSDHKIRLYDVTTGELLRTLVGHNDSITSMVVLSDGHLISASKNNISIAWLRPAQYKSIRVNPQSSYKNFSRVNTAAECWRLCDSDRRCLISSFQGPLYNDTTNCFLFNGLDYSLETVYDWTSYAVQDLDMRNLTTCISI